MADADTGTRKNFPTPVFFRDTRHANIWSISVFHDLEAYFYENVATAFDACRRVREESKAGISQDLRSVITAATVLFHFREHVPSPHNETRAQVAAKCPDYDLLGDIVNASKHRDLTRGNPQINSASDIYEIVVITEFEDSDGRYTNAEKQVLVKLKDGSERDVFEILTNVINFWGAELLAWNVLKSYNPFPAAQLPGTVVVPRSSISGVANLGLQGIEGLDLKFKFKFQVYDSVLGRPVPKDLNGATHEMRIFEPPKTFVTITAINKASGATAKRTVQLTNDQAVEYQYLETEQQKAAFVQQIAPELARIYADEFRSMHAEISTSTESPQRPPD